MRSRKNFVNFYTYWGKGKLGLVKSTSWKKILMPFKNRSMHGKEELLCILSILFTAQSPVPGRKQAHSQYLLNQWMKYWQVCSLWGPILVSQKSWFRLSIIVPIISEKKSFHTLSAPEFIKHFQTHISFKPLSGRPLFPFLQMRKMRTVFC